MEKIFTTKLTFLALCSTIAGWISSIYGGWGHTMTTLLIVMAIDYITGMLVACIWKKSNKSPSGALQSSAGWKGICRKVITLFMVLISARIDMILETDIIRNAVTIAYIINEIISICENATAMGVPIPPILQNSIDSLQRKNK